MALVRGGCVCGVDVDEGRVGVRAGGERVPEGVGTFFGLADLPRAGLEAPCADAGAGLGIVGEGIKLAEDIAELAVERAVPDGAIGKAVDELGAAGGLGAGFGGELGEGGIRGGGWRGRGCVVSGRGERRGGRHGGERQQHGGEECGEEHEEG